VGVIRSADDPVNPTTTWFDDAINDQISNRQ
jgi:hypothetical protein